jgi:hypothetical protein
LGWQVKVIRQLILIPVVGGGASPPESDKVPKLTKNWGWVDVKRGLNKGGKYKQRQRRRSVKEKLGKLDWTLTFQQEIKGQITSRSLRGPYSFIDIAHYFGRLLPF